MELHVLSGFSPDGKLFASINDQGVLLIWDTETNELKQEYTPSLHLSGPCTALIWVAVAEKRTPKKKSKNLENKLYLALGNSKGGVSLYSLAEGKISRSLKGEGHSGRVTNIVRGDNDEIYTSGDDCLVIKWSLATQERLTAWNVGPEKPQRLAYFEHTKKLAVGSRQIKVYSTESHELCQTMTGHSAEISLLTSVTVIPKGKVLELCLSSSAMERIICVWKVSKKEQNLAAVCTLLMEDIAHQISCHLDDESNVLKVASVTRSGVIHIYFLDVDRLQTEKLLKPKSTLEIATDDTKIVEPIPAIAVSLQHGHTVGQQILIGYGSKRFLIFEQLVPVYTQKKQVLVRKHPKCSNLQKSKQDSADNNESYVIASLKTLTPIVNPDDVEYKSSLSLSKKKVKPTEMPMESRLQNLNLGTPSTVGSQSKVQLLVQALHSKDAVLLRSVLQTSDIKTIELTLNKLPVQYVGPLVNELTQLMQLKRSNVEYSIKWLKVLLQTHASQLMALGKGDLMEKFGPCIGIIEYRSNCLRELSKLSGRLSLVVNQIKRNTEDSLNTEDALIYEDKEEDDDISDNVLSNDKETSDGEWDEDDNDDDADDDKEQMDIADDSNVEDSEDDEMET